jgi:hypothetical protein
MHHHRLAATLSLTVCCLLLLLSGLAVAQNQNQPHKGAVDVPFDFYISGNKLPAGQYTFDIIAPTYVMLRSQDGKVQQDLYFMQVASPTKNPVAKVVFSLRDGKYYLFEVWGWFGKSQLTSFIPQAGDQSKEIPFKPAEKDAKPAPGL